MARKRMLSPEMWESSSFSSLTDLSKLVFISLISHADDEGRGRAGAAYIRNMTFPNDEDRRVADIKKALLEIGCKMSVQFYTVDGNDYYFMTKWLKWQKIDKPTKSKLPPPPISVGEGGGLHLCDTFDEYSGSARGGVVEPSTPNRIERKGIEEKGTEEVSKEVSKNKNFQSYDEIFSDMEVSPRLKSALIDFIRHLQLNGVLMVNSRLEGLILKLDQRYANDDLLKCKEIRQAIINGYKRLPCEGG